jgi:cell volume regulation protein A
MSPNALFLLSGLLLFASVLATLVSTRFGFPLLLVFLGVGMLAGEDGPGGILFDDYETAFLVGNLALAVILLDGGLRTDMRTFRVALKPALSLATLGVLATAGVVGLCAWLLLDLDWRYALLLGAIVGSTDAAAVFSSLRHGSRRLNDRVEATLEIESGANDPMAIFLVVVMVDWLKADSGPGAGFLAVQFVQQLGIGALGGIAGGWLLAALLERTRLVDGLYALLVVSGGLALFGAMNLVGGSGFLAIYLAGLTIANRPTHATEHVLRAMDGLAWLAQSGMFLVLGLLVTPRNMLVELGPAIAIAAFLMLVARPLAVWLCLLPFRFPAREVGFISWVGLRGAVPIVLAIFPVVMGLEHSSTLFNVTFAVVLFSLLVQGSTIGLAARWLRVEVPRADVPFERHELRVPGRVTHEYIQLRVEPGARCIGARPADVLRKAIGPGASCAAIVRDGSIVFPDADTAFVAGDIAVLILPRDAYEPLLAHFTPLPAHGPLSVRTFFGEFVLDGTARAADVAAAYGNDAIADDEREMTVAEVLQHRLGRPLVVGDRVRWGSVTLTVREIEHDQVRRVGLKLAADD